MNSSHSTDLKKNTDTPSPSRRPSLMMAVGPPPPPSSSTSNPPLFHSSALLLLSLGSTAPPTQTPIPGAAAAAAAVTRSTTPRSVTVGESTPRVMVPTISLRSVGLPVPKSHHDHHPQAQTAMPQDEQPSSYKILRSHQELRGSLGAQTELHSNVVVPSSFLPFSNPHNNHQQQYAHGRGQSLHCDESLPLSTRLVQRIAEEKSRVREACEVWDTSVHAKMHHAVRDRFRKEYTLEKHHFVFGDSSTSSRRPAVAEHKEPSMEPSPQEGRWQFLLPGFIVPGPHYNPSSFEGQHPQVIAPRRDSGMAAAIAADQHTVEETLWSAKEKWVSSINKLNDPQHSELHLQKFLRKLAVKDGQSCHGSVQQRLVNYF